MTEQEIYQSWIEGLISHREAIAELCDLRSDSALRIRAMLTASNVPFYTHAA